MRRSGTTALASLKVLGPGVIAAASDNDPSTVATLAVIGATTGFGLLWLVILLIPMLAVVQVSSASVGVVTRAGLDTVVRNRYGRRWALLMLLAVLTVNLVTLAADIEGGAAALNLLTGWPYQWFLLPFALCAAALLIWGSYHVVEAVLRYVLLVFAAYVGAAFLARPDWGAVLHSSVVPQFSFSPAYVAGALALLGTTLTSYAYVWETIQESEERPPLRRLGLVRADAGLGMALAGLLFWFILVATGATLGVAGKSVQTAQDAAAALAPLAGPFASALFGIGLLASAILAVPVLAGTNAYVMSEMFHWRGNLEASLMRAPRFYAVVVFSLLVAIVVAYVGVSPIQLLLLSSIAGGLGTPLTLTLLMLVARDKQTMGSSRISRTLAAAGWAVAAVVTTADVIYLYQTFLGGGSG
ncbi:MAG: divalent metal cation transporter [Chloroflexota bacterium]|nr:divalent metal cation transporter [Chloroflexota bacterium]